MYIAKARQIADILDDPPEPETRPIMAEPDSDTRTPGLAPVLRSSAYRRASLRT